MLLYLAGTLMTCAELFYAPAPDMTLRACTAPESMTRPFWTGKYVTRMGGYDGAYFHSVYDRHQRDFRPAEHWRTRQRRVALRLARLQHPRNH